MEPPKNHWVGVRKMVFHWSILMFYVSLRGSMFNPQTKTVSMASALALGFGSSPDGSELLNATPGEDPSNRAPHGTGSSSPAPKMRAMASSSTCRWNPCTRQEDGGLVGENGQ